MVACRLSMFCRACQHALELGVPTPVSQRLHVHYAKHEHIHKESFRCATPAEGTGNQAQWMTLAILGLLCHHEGVL